MKFPLLLPLACAVAALFLQHASAAETDNLIMNGGFETGIQFWKGDGKVERLPDGMRVGEIEASKNRTRNLIQEFRMKELMQVEVIFRARSVGYTGPGLRISVHQPGGGSILWNRPLPEDGSWKTFRIEYTRANKEDRREVNFVTLLGTGKVQIDDVEVRAPSKLAESNADAPRATPAPMPSTPAPLAMVRPATPAPLRAATPAPTPTVPAPLATPALARPRTVPPGTFGSLEEILNSAPPEALQKLKDSATAEAGIAEINEFLTKTAKNRPLQVRGTAVIAEPMAGTRNKFRVQVADRPVISWAGGDVNGRLWAYFLEDALPAATAVTIGSELTVIGVIGRCDMNTKQRLQLNIDLQESKLVAP